MCIPRCHTHAHMLTHVCTRSHVHTARALAHTSVHMCAHTCAQTSTHSIHARHMPGEAAGATAFQVPKGFLVTPRQSGGGRAGRGEVQPGAGPQRPWPRTALPLRLFADRRERGRCSAGLGFRGCAGLKGRPGGFPLGGGGARWLLPTRGCCCPRPSLPVHLTELISTTKWGSLPTSQTVNQRHAGWQQPWGPPECCPRLMSKGRAWALGRELLGSIN